MIRWLAVPLVCVALALAAVSPAPWLSALFGLPALIGLVAARRPSLPASAHSLILVGALAAGFILPRPFATDTGDGASLSPAIFPFACAALLVASGRLYVQRPLGGAPFTVGCALVGLTVVGRADSGWLYPIAIASFVASAIVALWVEDEDRAPLRAFGARHGLALLAGAAMAAGVFAILAQQLPPLSRWAIGRLVPGGRAEIGFSDNLWLGSLEGLLDSDRVVMRVRGARVDYLRGAVYTSYSPTGRWSREWSDRVIDVVTPVDAPADPGVTHVEYAGRTTRYFAPLGPVTVGVATGEAAVDRHGIFRPRRASRAKRSWFVDDPEASPLPPPDTFDVQVPTRHFETLKATAREWTSSAVGHADKLAAIERHLAEQYAYSLDFEAAEEVDPTMDFLYRRRSGHCEYFASAMALLARTLGYPARVVGGYRVAEYNELGDYYIVRERHAHAWVEAWTPEAGWQTYDPTPVTPMVSTWRRETSIVDGMVDWVATTWERADDRLNEASPEELSAVLVALVALLPLLRWLRNRSRSRGPAFEVWAAAPGYFAELERALERVGARRSPAETIEELAARVAALGTERAEEGASLLKRYAALRYGGLGEEDQLARDIRTFTRG